jgi:DNA-directed RNA polymerase subunit RPC12/RpoP
MPRWMLKCPKCSHDFTHTKIELSVIEEAWRDPFQILRKPMITQAGETQTCPECKSKSVFQRHQLFYHEEPSDLVF